MEILSCYPFTQRCQSSRKSLLLVTQEGTRLTGSAVTISFTSWQPLGPRIPVPDGFDGA